MVTVRVVESRADKLATGTAGLRTHGAGMMASVSNLADSGLLRDKLHSPCG